MDDMGPRVAPDVVLVFPAVEVDAQLAHVDVGDGGAADETVRLVLRLQLHADRKATNQRDLETASNSENATRHEKETPPATRIYC